MSELKVHKAYNRWLDEEMPTPNDDLICNEVYLKSEADKFIADLEESHKMEVEQLLIEIAELKETLNNSRNARKYWRKEYLIEYKECLHHKYKRCLAMAKWCAIAMSYWDDDEQEGGFEYKKLQHCIRWKKRWLAIAEKFKINSTAQQGRGKQNVQ